MALPTLLALLVAQVATPAERFVSSNPAEFSVRAHDWESCRIHRDRGACGRVVH